MAGKGAGTGDYCERLDGAGGNPKVDFLYATVVSLNFILRNMRSCGNILSRGVIRSVYATLVPVAIMWAVD